MKFLDFYLQLAFLLYILPSYNSLQYIFNSFCTNIMITALNRYTILYTPNLMLLFMTTASTLSVFVEKAYVIEPKMSYTALNDAASVLAINKWHLYNSFMVMQDYVTSKYKPTDLIVQPTVVTKISDVFGILFKKIIHELKAYVLKFTDPKCSKKDIELVISTFLRSLEKSISPADFIPILDGTKEVYRQALKDNNMRYYYTDAYFMYLSNYITQEIYETHGKNPKLLTIWRKIVRKTYIQTVFTDQQCLIISPDEYKSVCLEYNAPIQLIESKNLFDDIIALLKKPAEITYENGEDTDVMVGYCFSIDISSYLISYFTRKAKEINENPNLFTHKNSIITDMITHLHVSKDHRKIINAIHLQKNVRVLFTNQSYKSIAEMLVFTNIDDDKIEKCWEIATAFLSIIKRYRRLSITAFANVFKIHNKKPIDPFIPYDLEDESSETETEIYSTRKTLMPFNVIVGESSFRIIYKNLVLCDKIHEMIDDEIIYYFYFFQSNLTPTKIMKLSSICGFSEQDNDGPTNTADESQKSKISDVNADNAEVESKTLPKNETECDKIEDDIKPIHLSNPKKANEQPKPTPMRQGTETHSRGKKIRNTNGESTQRKEEDSEQPSENVNNKQVDKSILPSGAPNVSSKSGSTRSDCKMQKEKDKVTETVVKTEISQAMHLDHKRNANIRCGSKTNSAVPANESSEEMQNTNKKEDKVSPLPETDIDQLGDYVKLFLKRHLQLQYNQRGLNPTKRDADNAREARDSSEQSKRPQQNQRGLNPAKRDADNAREASDNSEQSKKPQPNQRGLNPAKRDTNNAREARDNSEQSKKPQQNQRGLNPAKRGTDYAREARDNSEQSKKPQPNQSAIDVATQSLDGSGPPKRQLNRSKPDDAPQCTDQPINAEVKPRQSRRRQTNPSKIEEASQSIDKSTEATGKLKEGIRQQHNQTVTDVAHESTDKPTEATGKLEQSKGANPKAEKERQLRQFAESKISSSQDSKNAQMTQPTSPCTFAATVIEASASPMLPTTAEGNCYVETNLCQIADDAQTEPTVQAEALGTSNTPIEPPKSHLISTPALASCNVQDTGLNEPSAWNRVDNTTSESKEDNGTINEANNDEDSQSQVVKKVCDQFKTYQSSNGLYSLF